MRSKRANQKNTSANPWIVKVLLISFVCAAVFVAVLFWPAHGKQQQPTGDTTANQMSAKKAQPTVHCSVPDQSFCYTQINYANLIKRGFFASALEQQQPVRVTCGNPDVQTAYCDTAPKGTVLNAYKLTVSGATEYLSRNDYIAYFASFQKDFGPFIFENDSTNNGTITMHFKSSKSDTTYAMNFAKQSGDWTLQSVTVD